MLPVKDKITNKFIRKSKGNRSLIVLFSQKWEVSCFINYLFCVICWYQCNIIPVIIWRKFFTIIGSIPSLAIDWYLRYQFSISIKDIYTTVLAWYCPRIATELTKALLTLTDTDNKSFLDSIIKPLSFVIVFVSVLSWCNWELLHQ